MSKINMYFKYNLINILLSFGLSFIVLIPIINKNIDYYFLFIIGGVIIVYFLFLWLQMFIIWIDIKKDVTIKYNGEVINARLLVKRIGNYGFCYGVKIIVKENDARFPLYYYFNYPKELKRIKVFKCPKSIDCTFYKGSFIIKECLELDKASK